MIQLAWGWTGQLCAAQTAPVVALLPLLPRCRRCCLQTSALLVGPATALADEPSPTTHASIKTGGEGAERDLRLHPAAAG